MIAILYMAAMLIATGLLTWGALRGVLWLSGHGQDYWRNAMSRVGPARYPTCWRVLSRGFPVGVLAIASGAILVIYGDSPGSRGVAGQRMADLVAVGEYLMLGGGVCLVGYIVYWLASRSSAGASTKPRSRRAKSNAGVKTRTGKGGTTAKKVSRKAQGRRAAK